MKRRREAIQNLEASVASNKISPAEDTLHQVKKVKTIEDNYKQKKNDKVKVIIW